MSQPEFTAAGGIYQFHFEEENIKVKIDRLHEKSDQTISGEITLTTDKAGVKPFLHQARLNLTSTSARKTLASHLDSRFALDWDGVLEYVCANTLRSHREGEPTIEIFPSDDDTLEVEYLLGPILYYKHPTVLFGDYGSLKSSLALALTHIVQLPDHDNTLGLTPREESTPCLYLDYEDDVSSFQRRWSALSKGFGHPPMPILYRRMTGTLADSVEQLQRIILDKDIKMIVVDSLGPAAGGNLNEPEPAMRYHSALRQLGVTSLTLAHTSKDQLSKNRTIFGSVFFTNLARSVWFCKAEQETGEDEAIISLKHTKANLSRLHSPLGYRFTFNEDTIQMVKTDLGDTGLSVELPLSWQIRNILKRGSLSLGEISDQLNSSQDTVGRSLRRMRTKKEILKREDGSWGLST